MCEVQAEVVNFSSDRSSFRNSVQLVTFNPPFEFSLSPMFPSVNILMTWIFWGHRGEILATSWNNLGISWGHPEDILRTSWGNFGDILMTSWGHLHLLFILLLLEFLRPFLASIGALYVIVCHYWSVAAQLFRFFLSPLRIECRLMFNVSMFDPQCFNKILGKSWEHLADILRIS